MTEGGVAVAYNDKAVDDDVDAEMVIDGVCSVVVEDGVCFVEADEVVGVYDYIQQYAWL